VDEDNHVALRCSTIVFSDRSVLLIHRRERNDWVLPGGRPRAGEGMSACARREVREETGLHVDPGRVAFVLETISPSGERLVELVFLSTDRFHRQPTSGETGLVPAFVNLDALGELRLRPPLAGHLRAVHAHQEPRTAAYLGNLWRARTEADR
jgi:8-oxo-dGTP diphosphatase